MVAIKLHNVTKNFGDTRVLHGVDVHIDDGKFAVLVGPSGCGKSTLLRLIAGLEEVTAGRIEFGEHDVTALPPRDRDVAMVFQSYALYPHLSVRDNLAFGLKLRKTDPTVIAQRVQEVAGSLEITALLDRFPRQLSGGQRQRVAMGRAIVRRPAVFMFDEPLSNLDPALRTQVRMDIRRLHQSLGATSVYVTHDQVEAMTLADILFVLNQGVVQQFGTPLEIYERPANRFVAGFLGSPAMNFVPAVVSRRNQLPGVGLGDTAQCWLPLPNPKLFEHVTAETKVIVGVRAQDVRQPDPEAQSKPSAPLQVRAVETLGSHVHLHGELAGHPFIAAFEGSRGPAGGETIQLEFEHLHLFDPETGHSLRGNSV